MLDCRKFLLVGAVACLAGVPLWGSLSAQTTFQDGFERPDGPVGGWTVSLGNWAIAVGRPPSSTESPEDLAAPKFWPNSTTLVPTGPFIGSMRMEGSTVIGRLLLVVYRTGAQQDPSG